MNPIDLRVDDRDKTYRLSLHHRRGVIHYSNPRRLVSLLAPPPLVGSKGRRLDPEHGSPLGPFRWIKAPPARLGCFPDSDIREYPPAVALFES